MGRSTVPAPAARAVAARSIRSIRSIRSLTTTSLATVLSLAACRAPSPVVGPSAGMPAASAGAPVVAAPSNAPAPDSTRFQQDVLAEGVFNEPTEIAVMRDGRVLIGERPGTLKLYDPRRRDVRDLAGMPGVSSADENGLIGVALDPGFEQNGWIYVNYTPAVGDRQRLSRFTLAGDSLRDERAMLEVKIDAGCCHTGGSIAFDHAGNMFVSYGDNTNPFTAGDYAPIEPTPAKFLANALRSAANTQDLRGKILRIKPTADGRYTIPAGNLFASAQDGRPEIYTMGHRNPYRISVDSRSGALYWGEIGPDARRDSTLGPQGHDEFNQALRPGNFGWPMFIADNKPYRNYNFTTGQLFEFFDPARPVNASPGNTGAKVLPPAQPALIYYSYERSARFPLVGEGARSAMAGPVYRAADFPGSRVKLPEYYDGKFIHYEWMRGWMMATTLAPNGDFVRMEPFLAHLRFDHPSDVELAPDGSLYVVEYGTYWFAKNKNSRLSRITYHPDNRPPVAQLQASPAVGAAPLTTQLSAGGSFDRDPGDSLRFTWSIPGSPDREGQRISHTFTAPGTHRVRLRVRDRAGAEADASTDVRVGNTPPKVAITVAGNRSFYWDEPTLLYAVEVTDAEDGRSGGRVDPSRATVTMAFEQPAAAAPAAGTPGHRAAPSTGALDRMRESGCLACHGVSQASVGPAYERVGQRYAGRADATTYLMTRIASGSSGVWGDRVMPPFAALAPEVRRAMAEYILALGTGPAKLAPRGRLALARHASAPGGTYRVTAAYADQPRNGVGSLADTAVVVLRPPRIFTRDALDLQRIGLKSGPTPGGTERVHATVYEDNAVIALGRLDLTGVARLAFDLRSPPSRLPFAIELRVDSAAGPLLGQAAVTPAVGEQWYRHALPVSATGDRPLFVVVRSSAQGLGQWNPLVQMDAVHFER